MNDYQKQCQQLSQLQEKKKLLLHVCCGVCSVYPLVYLRRYFNISIFYANSNIYPYEEYQKRLKALETYLAYLNDPDIKLLIPPYDNKKYMLDLKPFAKEKEGGQRCFLCYEKRLRECFSYAKENHYDYVASVMSISNRKNAQVINQIGNRLANQYQLNYLITDLKKGNGITINEKMNKELNLYHQNYCGCQYSLTQD